MSSNKGPNYQRDFRPAIRIPDNRVDEVWRLSRQTGLPVSVMLRNWVLERLEKEIRKGNA